MNIQQLQQLFPIGKVIETSLATRKRAAFIAEFKDNLMLSHEVIKTMEQNDDDSDDRFNEVVKIIGEKYGHGKVKFAIDFFRIYGPFAQIIINNMSKYFFACISDEILADPDMKEHGLTYDDLNKIDLSFDYKQPQVIIVKGYVFNDDEVRSIPQENLGNDNV